MHHKHTVTTMTTITTTLAFITSPNGEVIWFPAFITAHGSDQQYCFHQKNVLYDQDNSRTAALSSMKYFRNMYLDNRSNPENLKVIGQPEQPLDVTTLLNFKVIKVKVIFSLVEWFGSLAI